MSARWRYEAADRAGVRTSGEIDAESERAVVDLLRRNSLWVTTVERIAAPRRGQTALPQHAAAPANATAPTFAALASLARTAPSFATATATATRWRAMLLQLGGRSPSSELAITIRAMSTLLAAGVPLDRALTYATGPSAFPGVQAAFVAVQRAVRAGDSLATAIGREAAFPSVFAPTVAAGEASGTLATAMASLADHLERTNAVREKLRAALIYPAILGLASVVGITVVMLVVVPRFTTLVAESGGTLPLSTRALIALSHTLTHFWWALVLAALFAGMLVTRWLARPGNRLRWDRARLRWPVVGAFERARAAAGYAGVLAVALDAGLSLLPAMRIARGTIRNAAIAVQLAEAEGQVRGGAGLAGGIEGVLPPLAVRLIDAGERGGNLGPMAARAAEVADAEVQRTAATLVSLVEPTMILGFGGVVGFVALALLQAIYGLNARP